eukprot:gene4608-7990_t
MDKLEKDFLSDPRYLAKVISSNDPELVSLNLRGELKNGKDVKIFMSSLDNNTTLKSLDLRDNRIKGRYFKYVKEALMRNKTLETLHLDGNLSTKLGLTRLLKAVEEYNFTIIDLTVDENVLTMEEVDILVDVIDRNQELKEKGEKPEPKNIPKRKILTQQEEEESDEEEQEDIVVVKHVVGSITPRMSTTPSWNEVKLKSSNLEHPSSHNRPKHQRSVSYSDSSKPLTKSVSFSTRPLDKSFKLSTPKTNLDISKNKTSSNKSMDFSISVEKSSPRGNKEKEKKSNRAISLRINDVKKTNKVKSNNFSKYEAIKGSPEESKFSDPKYIASLLYHDHPELKKLDLRGKIKNGKDLKIIMPSLDYNKYVKELDIRDNNIEGKYFKYLKETVKRNSVLEVIKMDGNCSTLLGLKRLIKTVEKYNNTLIDLQVDEKVLTMEEVDILMEVMERNEEYKDKDEIPETPIVLPRERLTVEEEEESDDEEIEKKDEPKHYKSTEFKSPREDPGYDKVKLKSISSFKLSSDKSLGQTKTSNFEFKNPFKRTSVQSSKLPTQQSNSPLQKSHSFSFGSNQKKNQLSLKLDKVKTEKPQKIKSNNFTKYEPIKGSPDESKFSDPHYVACLLYFDHPEIKKLDLRGKIQQGKDLKIIMPAIDNNKYLKELDIRDNNLEGRYFSYLKEAIKRNQVLEVIKMDGNLSTKLGLKRLIEAVKDFNFTIVDLQVDETVLTMEEIDTLMEVMDRNQEHKKKNNIPETIGLPQRERLTTEEENESDDEESEIIVEKKHFKSTEFISPREDPGWDKVKLKSIDPKTNPKSNRLSAPNSNSTSTSLKSPTSKEKRLQKSQSFSNAGTLPSNAKYQGPFAMQVHRARINDNYLTAIILKDKEMEDDAAEHIYASLEENVIVKKLNLQDNDLTDASIPGLIDLILKNKTLDTIELEGNKFSSKRIDDVIEALESNYSIIDIGICDKISDEQVEKLDKILDRNFEKAKKK